MPRGGGGFSGGGFRGGSFGGGFRGSSSSFRSSFRSSSRSSSRPFGRTGARRTTTSSRRSGPYSHRNRYPHRRYYRLPFYRRWWYSPWFGYYYRPWYYSPVYVGGGLVVSIILLLILLPLMGVAFAFPGSSYTDSGNVNYRSTETLFFNEYWYEYERVDAGSTMTFSVQSTPGVVSFAIADHPFDDFGLTTATGEYNYSITLQPNYYEYYTIFLRSGSTVQYDFNSSAEVDFFIADIQEFNDWYYSEPTNLYYESTSLNDSGEYSIGTTEDVYLVWYNSGNSSDIDVDISLSYVAVGVPDFSDAIYYSEAENHIESSIVVPTDETWYFFVYFDPMYSTDETVDITFDVTYETDSTYIDQWVDFRPTLITIGIISGIIIIFAVAARRTQKKKKYKEGTQPGTTQATTTTTTTTTTAKPSAYGKPSQMTLSSKSGSNCIRCGATMKPGDIFCSECGGKTQGRSTSATTKRTPINSKMCIYCGSKLDTIDNFCKYCGTTVNK